jgi:peptide/nickel transport system ATP-binding protein
VAQMAHRIGVMYAGQLIEEASRAHFFAAPAHPYSRKLFDALPEGNRGRLATIPGSVPPLSTRFTGCRFAARCDSAWARCHAEVPAWHSPREGQRVRCHLHDPAESARVANADTGGSEQARVDVQPGKQLLTVRDLTVHFPIRAGVFKRTVGQVRAVDGVSVDIRAGCTLALVGESGCGKTTVGKAILRLIEPTAGNVMLGEHDLSLLAASRLRALRSRMQMVFQDPFGSLNPRLHVIDIIEEGMQSLGKLASADDRRRHAHALLEQVGLRPDMADRYPHEFSGGQRQRIAIARALAVSPDLIICDEPTSALDVSVQAQILNLLQELQSRLGVAYLFITHNIAVVEYLAHEVAVMYLGRIVERGPVSEVLRAPRHPYTQALLAAVPRARGALVEAEKPRLVPGDIPSPSKPPEGCHFHPRCPYAMAACKVSYPTQRRVGDSHQVACYLIESSNG